MSRKQVKSADPLGSRRVRTMFFLRMRDSSWDEKVGARALRRNTPVHSGPPRPGDTGVLSLQISFVSTDFWMHFWGTWRCPASLEVPDVIFGPPRAPQTRFSLIFHPTLVRKPFRKPAKTPSAQQALFNESPSAAGCAKHTEYLLWCKRPGTLYRISPWLEIG